MIELIDSSCSRGAKLHISHNDESTQAKPRNKPSLGRSA
jgi:hypothetical protein